jgi:hypothetical protein
MLVLLAAFSSRLRLYQPNSKLAIAMHELNLNSLRTSYYAIR